ncbi:phosphotransferase [candidate division GN15 bacterium]|nr:phosphotransferase [candidate division GN15 bacterium]
MPFRKEVDENLRFLILEVRSQIEGSQRMLEEPGSISVESFSARDDYIDNLKGVIESKSFSQIFHVTDFDKQTVDLMKAVLVITSNLERIADHAVNIVGQTQHYKDPSFIKRYDFEPFYEELFGAIDLIYEATFSQNIKTALRICRSEFAIDDLYRGVFETILEELRSGEHTEDRLTSIFIFRYLERMGDSLLNIGEAVISAAVGEKLKIHQYEALEETLQGLQITAPLSDFSLKSIWETRSGCRIARIENKNGGELSRAAIFKEGRLKKLTEEKENIERWQQLVPGLPPQVFGFQRQGENGLLLLEYCSGRTLKELVMESSEGVEVEEALGHLTRTLRSIWSTTRKPIRTNAHHFSQLLARIDEVHKVHPDYHHYPGDQIGSVAAHSFDQLVERAIPIEAALDAPFTVFIHGDLNVDNVIYDQIEKKIHFIDLHRSSETDYVQDVAVFIVSNFRLPVQNNQTRMRLNWIGTSFYEFAKSFAEENDDRTFDARLTLGLIRSFTTSTRFELEEEFAKSMYLRAIFLLEKMIGHDGRPWEEFTVPRQALVH